MKQIFTAISIFIIIGLTANNSAIAQINTQDSLALVDFYYSTDGPHWPEPVQKNWLTTAPVSTWAEITVAGNRVTEMNFVNSAIGGPIPASFGNLTALKKFSANYGITGTLPASIGNLTALQSLSIYFCDKLKGPLPSSIGNLKNLEYLYLYSDNISGKIPSSLGNLTKLKLLNISGSHLEGDIPSTLNKLINLETLDLSYNRLSGTIPDLSSLNNLRAFSLTLNKLSGNIPSYLSNFKHLTTLGLGQNNLTGRIPPGLGNLDSLSILDLHWNHLTGEIPESNWPNLFELNLSLNQLSGKIPSSLAKFPTSAYIHLENNNFSFAGLATLLNAFPYAVYSPQANVALNKNNNTLSVYAGGANALADNTYKWYKGSTLVATVAGDSTFTPTQNGNYSVAVTNSVATALTLHSDTVYIKTTINKSDSLALVDFYNSTKGTQWSNNTNWLTAAPVSTWFGITVVGNRVTEISFYANNLNGSIPASFGNLTGLKSFSVYYGLKGAFPSSTGNLTALQSIVIARCEKFNGALPSSLGNLKNLETLYLYEDNITGTIPSSLGNLTNLLVLWINGYLSGSIPGSLNHLTNLEVLDLSFNYLSGAIPKLDNLQNLTTFNLRSNNLSGEVPSYLSHFKRLKNLALAGNNLVGFIPSKLGNLDSLTSLDLQSNNLTGEIPKELDDCINLEYLNLSSNKLTGKIPYGFNKFTKLRQIDLSNNQLSYTIPSLNNLKLLYSLNFGINKFTFAGMEQIVKKFPFAIYSPQATVKLNKNANTLSVYAGGANVLVDNTYKWYKGSTLVATITGDSTYQPTQTGNYSVAVTNSVATALTLYSDTVNYSSGDNLIAALINNKISSASLYPNPAKTNATLSFTANGKYTITVADISGKILQTKTGIAIKGSNNIQLDVSKYASGMYLITITDEKNKKQTLRLNKE